jgi:hypothetical protein
MAKRKVTGGETQPQPVTRDPLLTKDNKPLKDTKAQCDIPDALAKEIYRNEELRRYVNLKGRFRTGLTPEQEQAGEKIIKKLGLPMPPKDAK